MSRTSLVGCAAMLMCGAILAASAQAQTKVVVKGASDSAVTPLDQRGWAEVERLAKLTLTFAGTQMTNSRAGAIANTAGFDFVGWQTCPSTDNCMILEVKGRKAGWVYRYVLLGERCLISRTTEIDPSRPGITADLPSARTSRQAGRSAAAGVGTDVGSIRDDFTFPEDEDGEASGCFGGYSVVVRARQHSSYVASYIYYTGRQELIYQAVADRRWIPFATYLTGVWQTAVEGSGMTERGSSYSWLDGDDKVVAEDAEQVQWIASSGSEAGDTAADLCQRHENSQRTKLTQAAEPALALVCLAIPLPQTITIGGGGSANLQPGGVGGTISLNGSASKTFDYCAANRNIALSQIEATVDAEYNDCRENPGRYFPDKFAPEPDELSLAGYLGFEPLTPTRLIAVANCPIAKTDTEVKDMGGGWQCTVTTKSFCSVKNDECECKPSGPSETVCTGG